MDVVEESFISSVLMISSQRGHGIVKSVFGYFNLGG